jgi:septum formation protein
MSISLRRRVYLASRSPRRRELLKQIGVEFELLMLRESTDRARDVDETPLPREAPDEYAVRVAQAKAAVGMRYLMQRRLPRMYPVFPLVAADTAVALEGEILGKPDSIPHATDMLRRLSGRTHQVYTAVSVAFEDQVETALSRSDVTFGALDDAEIAAYVASTEPMDKAGAYAIQGLAAVFVESVSGSYSGVVGLPLFETAGLLKHFGCGVL